MTTGQLLITDAEVPRAAAPIFQHLLDTYTSETNKTAAVWRCFDDGDLPYRHSKRANTIAGIVRHHLLSERRFFAEFLGHPEQPPDEIVPTPLTVADAVSRLATLARPRLARIAACDEAWWLEEVPFFDVRRQRIWIFWRRVLHSAHHRTQLTVYLRVLGRPVPAVYGPSADQTWEGADPTTSAEAAGRR